MKRLLVAALTASALLLGGQPARADFVTYDTTGSWDGKATSSIGSFGLPPIDPQNQTAPHDTPTFGETFVGPAGQISYLRDFSFHVNPSVGVHLQFAAYVYAWTGPLTGFGGHVTGSALYSSPIVTLDGTGSFQTVTFHPEGAATFNPGSSYVALLTVDTPGNTSTPLGITTFGLVALPHHAGNGGGGFVFDQKSTVFTSTQFTTVSDRGDLAWTADFQAVPEPSALALAALAACTFGFVTIRCRRRQLPFARRER